MLPRPATLTRNKQSSFGRLLLVALLAIAFSLQSYVVQTHFHAEDFAGIARLGAAAPIDASSSTPGKNTPADDSQDKCPLCQLLHGGQYLTPKLISLLVFLAAVSTVRLDPQHRIHFKAASHSWRGRAPPKI